MTPLLSQKAIGLPGSLVHYGGIMLLLHEICSIIQPIVVWVMDGCFCVDKERLTSILNHCNVFILRFSSCYFQILWNKETSLVIFRLAWPLYWKAFYDCGIKCREFNCVWEWVSECVCVCVCVFYIWLSEVWYMYHVT